MSRWPIDPAQVALGELNVAEHATAEALLASDEDFRAAVDEMRALVARVDMAGDDIWHSDGPPAFDPTLFTSPDPTHPTRARRSRVRVWAPLTGVAVVAVTIVAFLMVRGDDPAFHRTVALQPIGNVPGRATLDIEAHEMHLVATGLPQLPPKSVYEAWLGRADGSMVSVGTFTVDAGGNVDGHMRLTVNPADFTLVDVSLEPDDGNPAHGATSVFRATISPAGAAVTTTRVPRPGPQTRRG